METSAALPHERATGCASAIPWLFLTKNRGGRQTRGGAGIGEQKKSAAILRVRQALHLRHLDEQTSLRQGLDRPQSHQQRVDPVGSEMPAR